MAAEVSRGLGRHGWAQWRSSANGVGYFVGDGEVQMPGRRKRSESRSIWSFDLAKTFERVSLLVVWASATHFNFPWEDTVRMLFGYLEQKRRVQFEGCVAEPLRVEMELLAVCAFCCRTT